MEAHEALDRLTQRGILGKSLLRGRDRRQLQSVTLGIDREFDSFMVGYPIVAKECMLTVYI
jgi:hypothetical protein